MMTVIMMMIMMVMVVIMMISIRAYAFDVMVMALLWQTHLIFKPQHLGAILAQFAIHRVLSVQDLSDALGKSIQYPRMIAKILRFDKINMRMTLGYPINGIVNAFDQYAGKQEIRKHHDAFKTEFASLF